MKEKQYLHYIYENKKRLTSIMEGKLIDEENQWFEQKWIDDFNAKVLEYNVLNMGESYIIYDGEDSGLLQECLNIRKKLVQVDNTIVSSKQSFLRNFSLLEKEIERILKELDSSKQSDYKISKENSENNRMHDMSTGVFSHEEAGNRAFFNMFVKPYVSSNTNDLKIQLDDAYKRMFSYSYFIFEEITYIALFMVKEKPEWITWRMKFECLNMLPLGEKLEEETALRMSQTANYYKHQNPLPLDFQTLDHKNIKNFINKIYKKLEQNSGFDKIINSINYFSDEVDGIQNPFGLTGFE